MHDLHDKDEAPPKERVKKNANPQQPGLAKKEGDDSPNPLPNALDEPSPEGGDPGRT